MVIATDSGRGLVTGLAALALLTASAIAAGCTSRAGASPAATAGENVQIQVGHTEAVEAEALKIAFEGVSTDSRCPKGEMCVWEGDAVAVIAIEATGRPPARIELHTSAKMPSAAGYEDWSIRLESLEPYPVTGHTTPPTASVATIAITRGADSDVATR